MNTLKFASTAANISNRPVSNVRVTPISNIAYPEALGHHQQFLPIAAPAHLYPSVYNVTAPLSRTYIHHQNLNTFPNDNAQVNDSEDPNQIEDELFKYLIICFKIWGTFFYSRVAFFLG